MSIYKKINEYLDNKEKTENYRLIDYTNISNNLNNDTIKELCKNAEDNNFYSVAILPEYVAICKSFAKNNFKVSSIIDFPKGDSGIKSKLKLIEDAIINGVDEIDIVINYNLIKNKENYEKLENEIRELTQYCHKEGVIIKTTIEIGALNYQEIEDLCKMCIDNNVDFITTSTGKLSRDDSFETKLEKVKFMRKILPDNIGIKFSGGIRTNEQIKQIKEFVDRIATSVLPQ